MRDQRRKGSINFLLIIFVTMFLLANHGLLVFAEDRLLDKDYTEDIDSTGANNPINPVHHCTQQNDGSDYTDWSYVYFGSYPQSEVTGSALTSAIIGASYDANGDAWVNGIKYRRISKSDTNYTYRYFKWERIKWKVLKNNGSTLFVVADKGLDCKDYHDPGGSVTWESSTIRSWLNDDFYQAAFSRNERNAIVQQNIVNEDNSEYGTEGGNNTQDNIYLLSIREAGNQEYGFCETYSTYSASRRVEASNYAHARGAFVNSSTDYAGNCWWWLRSPGYAYSAAIVNNNGYVYGFGHSVDSIPDACVPALHINLSSDLWSQTDDGSSGSGGIVPVIPTVSRPASQSVKSGTSATFRVTASSGNPNTYTYQWYYAASASGTGTRIDGAASSSYTIPAGNVTSNLNGRYYYCVVSNGIYDVPSDRAKLTVYKAPNVTAPSSKSVEAGTSVTFSVSASGGNPNTYTYQWYYAASASGTGTRINGAASSSYTISSGSMTTALNGRYYYCVVSNGQYDVESGRAKLTVTNNGQNTPTGTPANPVHHCTGENDGSDYTDWSYVYFGSYPQSEVTGNALTSAITGASYDANGDAWVNGIKYRRISKSDTNNNEYFGDSTYRYFKWERIKWRVLKNDGAALFVMADKGLDCKNYDDQNDSETWKSSTIRSWLNDNFYQTVFNSNERNAIVPQTIVDEDNPAYNTIDRVYLLSISEVMNPDYGFCERNGTYSASRRVKASDYAHARGAVVSTSTDYLSNCVWRLRSPGSGQVAAGYYDGDISTGKGVYTHIFDDDACVPALHINLSSDLWSQTDDGTSGSGGIVPVIPTVSSPESQSVKSGTSVTFRVTASSGNPNTYTYQWYYAASQTGTGTRIDGATSASYTIPAGNVTSNLNGRYYYCVVSNGIYDVPSDRAKLTVYKAPNVTAPASQSVEAGTGVTFSISASGGNPGTYTYQWYYAASASGTGTRINGATSSSYTISSGSMTTALSGRYYYCVVSNGQYQVTSGRARLTVQSSGSSTETHTPPTVSGLSEWYSRAVGTSLELTVTASGGNPDIYTYQWYYATSESGAGTKINGAVSSTYTIPASEMTLSINNRYYYCIVSNGSYNVESRRTRIFVYNETNPGSGTGGNGASSSAQIIYASSYTKEYGSKAFFIEASTNGNGKLTYQSSNKKVAEVSSNGQVKIKGYGTAIVTIRASQTQEYKAASKQITIEVIPKKIALKKVGSPGSRRISINWKKGKKIKGYELYISSSKNFKSNTFRRVFGKSKTNTALTGLKSGKKYYVKIRSYVKVGKKKYYSEWSKTKNVKIK